MTVLLLDELPADSDDIAVSETVGRLLASGVEELKRPFDVGNMVTPVGVTGFKVDNKLIPTDEIGVRRVTDMRYVHTLVTDGNLLKVVGWTVQLEGFHQLFPADKFRLM